MTIGDNTYAQRGDITFAKGVSHTADSVHARRSQSEIKMYRNIVVLLYSLVRVSYAAEECFVGAHKGWLAGGSERLRAVTDNWNVALQGFAEGITPVHFCSFEVFISESANCTIVLN